MKLRLWLVLSAFLSAAFLTPAGPETPDIGKTALRIRVTDAETGRPSPCTVLVTDGEGRSLANDPGLGRGRRCSGTLDLRLPAGPVTIRVTRGFETEAVERKVELRAGPANTVDIRLTRTVDLRKRGWYAGDSHAHMIHGEKDILVGFPDVAQAARAEDLQYLSLSHAWNIPKATPEALEAAMRPLSIRNTLLTWNLEAPKNYYKGDATRCLGHCWMIGMSGRTASGESAIDLLLQSSAADYEVDEPSHANFESHALIHRLGGAVFYTHPLRWWHGSWGGQGGYPKQEKARVSNMAVELPLDVLLGPTFDGLDVITTAGELEANEGAFRLWAMLLNQGYRLAATASSDTCFDRPGGAGPGRARTYTYLPGGFTLDAARRATAAGRTFATTGPLLLVSVDGNPPGSEFPGDGATRSMRIEAWASGEEREGLARIEVLRNGESFRVFPITGRTANLTVPLTDRSRAWYCVRAYAADPKQRAISGAFYVQPGGMGRPPRAACRVLARVIDEETGKPLPAQLTEMTYLGPTPVEGRIHDLPLAGGPLFIPGTVRLRASAPGYRPVTLSPFLDNPALLQFITSLDDKALLNWRTYEYIRALLARCELTFRMKKE